MRFAMASGSAVLVTAPAGSELAETVSQNRVGIVVASYQLASICAS